MDKTPIQLAANTTFCLREQNETSNQYLPTLYDVTTVHEDATIDVSDCYVWNSNADRLLWLEIRSGGRQTGIKLIPPFYDGIGSLKNEISSFIFIPRTLEILKTLTAYHPARSGAVHGRHSQNNAWYLQPTRVPTP